MADRAGALDTLVGRFVERNNDGRISDGAVVVSAADLGVEEVPVGTVAGTPTVPGDMVSVVVPAGSRAIKIAISTIEHAMVLVPGEALGDGPITLAEGSGDRVVGITELLPDGSWTPTESGGGPSSDWLTSRAAIEKVEISVEKVERAKSVHVSTGSSGWGEAFGLEKGELRGRDPDPDETFEPEQTLLVLTGEALLESWPDDGPPVPSGRLDFGDAVPTPAPMGGVSFSVAVLSTPTASVAGKSANPLTQVDTSDLLEREEAKRLLSRAGISDVDNLAWAAGPEPVDPGEGPETVTLLGTETDIESFVGVVEGESGPWGVGVHLARADDDDHVVVVGVHRRAVGSADGTVAALREGSDLVEARKLLAETVAQLATG